MGRSDMSFTQQARHSVSLFGFGLGMKQPSIQLHPELVIPRSPDFSNVEDELLERFGIVPRPIKTQVRRDLAPHEKQAVWFGWQAMGLACSLLQAIRMPCFDRGAILDIQTISRDEQRYRLSCLLPAVERQSMAWMSECFEWSCRFLSQRLAPASTEAKVSELMEQLHETFIVPARKKIPGGDSTIPVLKTAFQLDIPFHHVGGGVYQLGWGSKRRLSLRSTSELDSALGAKISQDKAATAQLLRQAGLPVPVHLKVGTKEGAIEAARRLGYPLVVKPADRDRGEGVTVNLHDDRGVAAAFDHASKLSSNILVEQLVPGICHRLLVTGAVLQYVVARLPLSVEGDGVTSVGDLIARANQQEARKAKHRRQKLFPSDELAVSTLKDRGMTLESIPGKGVKALLRPIESTEWGGIPQLFTDDIHPENLRVAVEAAQLLGLNVAGVDLISEDIRKPWYENRAVINEVNVSPYLGQMYEYQQKGVERLVRDLFPDGARIPVEVFIGDGLAWSAAQARLREFDSTGSRAVASSHEQTSSITGEIRLALTGREGLHARVRALLMSPTVDVLLLVVQTDEFLARGLPVDSIDTVTLINQNLRSASDPSQRAGAETAEMLLQLLEPYRRVASSFKQAGAARQSR